MPQGTAPESNVASIGLNLREGGRTGSVKFTDYKLPWDWKGISGRRKDIRVTAYTPSPFSLIKHRRREQPRYAKRRLQRAHGQRRRVCCQPRTRSAQGQNPILGKYRPYSECKDLLHLRCTRNETASEHSWKIPLPPNRGKIYFFFFS